MAKKVFKSDLSVNGIENLKKDLLNYKNNTLQQNLTKYVSRLLEIGITVAQTNVNESPLGKYVTLSAQAIPGKVCQGILIAKGEVKNETDDKGNSYPPFSTILAIEFGAGVHFNPTPNPNADKFGLGVGTFPGQTHAFEDMWFYWDEKAQKWRPTHGVKATMPMYNAQMKMIQDATRIAREVFR